MPVLTEARASTLWLDRYAHRTEGMTSSAIRDLLKMTGVPGLISFAGGMPAPEALPVAEIEAASARVLREHGRTALQYAATEGYEPLRELLVRHMARYGIAVGPENVLVTTGAQQALDLIGKLLINPGDRVATEDPTYLGAIQAFTSYQARFLTVPADGEGMRVDRLEAALRGAPKFIYVLPNFQNPGGSTLSLERRRRLLELAADFGIPVVEDDPYGQLRYEGEHLPALVRLDAEMHGCARGERSFRGSVLYVGTLSKTLAPGLRVGWVVAPAEIVARLAQMKQGADLHSSTFAQMVAYETARGGFLDRHVRRLREVYRERRDAMLAALERHFPAGARWTRPKGGLFLWVELPLALDTRTLLARALEAKVAFVPGAVFHPHGGGAYTMRLNFSYVPPDVIEEGVRRLGRVVAQALSDRSPTGGSHGDGHDQA
jgi:2-aminoadipate transaminase